jgi:hypothetical protein
MAGIEVDSNNKPIINPRPKWIRPVSTTTHGEIPNHIAESFQILDIIEISLTGSRPNGFQSENVTFKSNSLRKVGSFKMRQIMSMCESSKYIFGTRYDSLSEEAIANLDHSLLLVKPESFKVVIRPNSQNPDRPKHRLEFFFNGFTYDFSITDLAFLKKYQANPKFFAGIHEIALSLSVGVKFIETNRYYKLVAGIIY